MWGIVTNRSALREIQKGSFQAEKNDPRYKLGDSWRKIATKMLSINCIKQ